MTNTPYNCVWQNYLLQWVSSLLNVCVVHPTHHNIGLPHEHASRKLHGELCVWVRACMQVTDIPCVLRPHNKVPLADPQHITNGKLLILLQNMSLYCKLSTQYAHITVNH
jgi:hypothetical protein